MTDTSGDDRSVLQEIRVELEDLKTTAAAFSVSNIRDGSWFNKFLSAMLDRYSSEILEKGGVEYFRAKYPGHTQDQIADKLCTLATRYAALAGGASGATSSVAFAATIGTGGLGGAAAVSGAMSAIVAEMLFTTRVQIRLVYDLSVVYGYPLDVTDPEDLYRAFSLAYGLSFAAGNAGALAKAATPELARAHIRALIHGHTQAIQAVAIRLLGPRLGRQITQKAILRTAVPVVGVVVSSSWNYVSTSGIASSARHELRARAILRDAVRDLAVLLEAAAEEDSVTVLEALLALAMADGTFQAHEQEVYNRVVAVLRPSRATLEALERRVEIDPARIEARLGTLSTEAVRRALAETLMLVAVSDGTVGDAEVALLSRWLPALGAAMQQRELEQRAAHFRRNKTFSEQATAGVGAAASKVGGVLGSLFGGKKAAPAADAASSGPEAVGPAEAESEEEKKLEGALARLKKLADLHREGILTDAEFESKKTSILGAL